MNEVYPQPSDGYLLTLTKRGSGETATVFVGNFKALVDHPEIATPYLKFLNDEIKKD